MLAVSEGIILGEKLGIDPKLLTDILSVSTSSCWCVTDQNPRPGCKEQSPSSKNYEGGFQTSLMRKDLSLALDCSEAVNVDSEFAKMSVEYYRALEKKGYGGKDFGFAYQYMLKNKEI